MNFSTMLDKRFQINRIINAREALKERKGKGDMSVACLHKLFILF